MTDTGPWDDYKTAEDGPWNDYARPQMETGDTGLLESAASGAAAGLTGAATWPVAVGRLVDEGVKHFTGHDSGIDWSYYDPVGAVDQGALPPHNPDYELLRQGMSVAAPVAVTGGLAGLRSVPLKTAAIVGGAKAGETIGENTIGGDFGRDLGSTLGGMAGASAHGMANRAVQGTMHRAFTNEETPALLAAADRLGVPPSIGLIGNRRAQEWEDMGAGWPIADVGPRAARTAQTSAIIDAADRLAGRVRSGGAGVVPSRQDIIDQGTLGHDASALAENVNRARKKETSALQEQIINTLPQGEATPVPSAYNTLHPLMVGVSRDPSQWSGYRSAVEPFIENLKKSRDTVSDPALEARLQAQLQTAPPDAQSAILDQIANNRTLSYGALKGLHTDIMDVQENGKAVENRVRSPVEVAARDLMKNTVVGAGMPEAVFEAIQARSGHLLGQKKPLKNRNVNPGEGTFSSLLNGGRLGTDASRALFEERTHPSIGSDRITIAQQQKNLLGDLLEYRLLGKQAGAMGSRYPAEFNSKDAARGFAKIGREPRDTMAPPGTPLRLDLDALRHIVFRDAKRPTRATPQGGNTLGLPGRMFGFGAGAGIGALYDLPKTLAALGLAYTVPRGFSSEAFARYAAAKPVPIMEGAGRDALRAAPAVVNTMERRR